MVAKALQNLMTAVRHNERPMVVPGFLRPIDTDRIARDLNIESTARQKKKRSRQQRPPSIGQAFNVLRTEANEPVLSSTEYDHCPPHNHAASGTGQQHFQF
jgi:hypothetical protein